MATFIESPRFPDRLTAGLEGGPAFNTAVIRVQSGQRTAQVNWQLPLRTWRVQHIPVSDPALFAALRDFFMAVRGQAYGFRLRDPFDWQDDGLGFIGEGIGAGTPTLQLTKRYGLPGWYSYRPIYKPATVALKRNGSTIPTGSGAGQAALDLTTGLVTFGPEASGSVASLTPGATTIVSLGAPVGLVAGQLLYVTGLAGTAGAALNGRAWPIASVSGAAYTLNANTAGLVGGSGGTAYRYPQPADVLTWQGTFDTPAHFATDEFLPALEAGNVISFPTLVIEEERHP